MKEHGLDPISLVRQVEKLAGEHFGISEEELSSASDSDKRLWAEELEGLSLQSAREILQLKQSLNSLERPAEPSETNRSHDDDRTRGN